MTEAGSRIAVVEGARPAAGGEATLRIPLALSARLAVRAIVATAAVSAGLLAGTAAFIHYYRALGGDWKAGGWVKLVLIQLYLGGENESAAWFSSMMLLAVAVGAAGCFLVDRAALAAAAPSSRALSFGWLALAAGFAGLSLDEMGSLHERIGLAEETAGHVAVRGLDPLTIPMLVVAVPLGLFAFLHLRRRPLVLGLTVLGGALLATVPAVELLETRRFEGLPTLAWLDEPMWMVAEEGLELLASLAFLAATMAWLVRGAADASRLRGRGDADGASLSLSLRAAVLGTAVLGAATSAAFVVSAAIVSRLPAGDTGIPHNWFTSAPAAVAAIALACAGRGTTVPPPRHRRLYRLLAGYCAAVSLYYGANLGYWVSELPRGARLRPLAEGAMIAAAVGLGWGLAGSEGRWWGRAAAVGWAALLSIGLARTSVVAGWTEAVAFGLLWLALLSHCARRGDA